MTLPVKTVALFLAKEGHQSELEKLLRDMVAPSRAEPGNLRYDLWQDVDIPHRFVLDELYQDAKAVTAHRATPHFQNYLTRINTLAERTATVVHAVDVAGVVNA